MIVLGENLIHSLYDVCQKRAKKGFLLTYLKLGGAFLSIIDVL